MIRPRLTKFNVSDPYGTNTTNLQKFGEKLDKLTTKSGTAIEKYRKAKLAYDDFFYNGGMKYSSLINGLFGVNTNYIKSSQMAGGVIKRKMDAIVLAAAEEQKLT